MINQKKQLCQNNLKNICSGNCEGCNHYLSRMSPKEYVDGCSDPGDAVGAQYVQAEVFGHAIGWTTQEIETAKELIAQRYYKNVQYSPDNKVRYV